MERELLSQLLGWFGGRVRTDDPLLTSVLQWASRMQEHVFGRWHRVALSGTACQIPAPHGAPCVHPAVSLCHTCGRPTCIEHAAPAISGELWCLPCLVEATRFLRGRPRPAPAEPGPRRAAPPPPRGQGDELRALRKQHLRRLGLGEGASPDEVKAAFRRLGHKHHPDRFASAGADKRAAAAARFSQITESYHWLVEHEGKSAA